MRFFKTRKGLALVAGVVAVAVAAAGAYAYFTAAGSGTGQFTSGKIGTVTITSNTVGPLYPQTNPAATTPITVSITNNGGGSQYVGAVSGVVDPTSLPAGCQASWFTIGSAAAPGLVASGATVTKTSSVILNDNGTNQNACANATFTIDWTTASG